MKSSSLIVFSSLLGLYDYIFSSSLRWCLLLLLPPSSFIILIIIVLLLPTSIASRPSPFFRPRVSHSLSRSLPPSSLLASISLSAFSANPFFSYRLFFLSSEGTNCYNSPSSAPSRASLNAGLLAEPCSAGGGAPRNIGFVSCSLLCSTWHHSYPRMTSYQLVLTNRLLIIIQPNLSTSSTQSAQSAATRAFLQSQPSSNNLSSAAAAAALRSLTPTPTPVENVQTKRMLQRKSSISSQPATSGSPILRPSSRNGLRRVNSSGSMSARTFRDQSPGRPTSSHAASGVPAVAPPLPAIPPEFTGRNNQSRRSVSLGPNIWSSNSRTQAADGTSDVKPFAALPESPTPGVRKTSPEHQRSESRNSINFSYPMNSRANSPTIPSGLPDRREAVISGTRNDLATPEDASHNKRPVVQPAKAARQQTQRAEPVSPGSPVRSQRTAGTALLAAQAAIVNRHDEPITPPVSSRPTRQREQQATVERSPSRSPASVDTRSRPLVKKPSTITEERQLKEHPQPQLAKAPKPAAVPAPPAELPRAQTPPVADKPKEQLKTPPVSPPRSHLAAELDGEPQVAQLRQSASPGRSAHFPSQLAVISLPGEQLHQPPPRSVSPAKSALKRNSSLSPDGRIHGILRPGPSLSELSDATSVASDDGLRPNIRRKPVKVSFDDEAEVVGVAADPPTPPEESVPESPPGKSKPKSSWFNLHKRKTSPKRSTDVDEFDGVLKPRAALPSFGSIRAGRDGGKSEPPPQDSDDDELTSSDEDQHWGSSNDHAIGSIISSTATENVQKQVPIDNAPPATTQIAARDEAEPLEENRPVDESDSDPAYFHKTPLSPLQEVPSEQNLALAPEPEPTLETPNITLQPATPELEKGRQSLEEYDEPLEYPQSSEDVESKAARQKKGRRKSYGETDDDSSESVYSDAEEGYDGDGFGSINAILDRDSAPEPRATAEPGLAISSADEGHQTVERDDDIPVTCQIAHLESPTLDDSKRSASGSPELIEPLPVVEPPAQSEPERAAPQSSTMPVEVYAIAHVQDEDDLKEVDTRYQQPGTDTYSAPQVRSQENKRPESLGPSTRKEIGRPNGEVNGKGHNTYIPQRTLSNGSDSSSSFTRARRPSRGGMGMRRTLRGSQISSSVPASSNRVTPPVEFRPLPSGLGAGTMRTTLRGSGPRKEKPSLFSTGKSQKGKGAKGSGTPFRSRFEDSDSDSDGGVQNRLRHRPTRSMSDNDMRPVRGIPRRTGTHDGDSTELEDSSEGEGMQPSAPRTHARRAQRAELTGVNQSMIAAVAKSRGMTEEELEQLLNRGSSGSFRKPNLLNRLSMRKSKPQRGKLQPPGLTTNGTIPEDLQQQAQGFGNDSYKVTVTANPASPSRLLKKSPRKPSDADAWPLASEHGDPVDSGIGSTPSPSTIQQPLRPATSDGTVVNGNKTDSNNLQTALDEDQSAVNGGHRASDVVIEGSGRKKRFQRLRNALKIR
ncbi:hypothetical protein BJY01DRAFT_146289 [Aspergillus pseudoustus]|uniref:Uncharacterized protein n=1 Tax=Aspergillus pseudoustus TaxID=1810923 RepID=A0ABR4KA88_9EURO